MKHLKKIFKSLVFMLNRTEEARRNMVDMGVISFSGQGRDKYGR